MAVSGAVLRERRTATEPLGAYPARGRPDRIRNDDVTALREKRRLQHAPDTLGSRNLTLWWLGLRLW